MKLDTLQKRNPSSKNNKKLQNSTSQKENNSYKIHKRHPEDRQKSFHQEFTTPLSYSHGIRLESRKFK